VIKKRREDKKDPYTPLFGLLPFVLQTATNCVWLAYSPAIFEKGHLTGFCLMWGLQFAYQVGLLITAHTTKQAFPFKNGMMALSVVCALDAVNSRKAGAIAFQTTDHRRIVAIYVALAIALANYAFFVTDVISTVSVSSLYRLRI
jgi:ethanolaminephosphotransferase